MHKLEANITYSRYTNACPNEVSFQSANSKFKMGKAAIPGLGGGVEPRRANLSVRFTDKNGNHAEAGKIWENQIFTVKMGLHRPKCTQMYESICQGFRNIWWN